MNTSVVVLTPNGRRNTVKCNPNTTILQILEQTCSKHGFQPEEYDLKHHNHVLDMSATFRFSGLPNNAFLEMAEAKTKRKESEVIIGLQLENGERIMGNFSPSTNLRDILTSQASQQCDPELNPVIIYMRNEVYGDALDKTTLKSLGLTGGRAILRLLHRTPEQLKIQANVSSPLVIKPKEEIEISFNTSSVLSSTKLGDPANIVVVEQKSDVISDSENVLNATISTLPNESSSLDSKEDVQMDTNDSTEPDNTRMETDITSASELSSEDKSDDSHLAEEIIVLGERNALVFSQNMASRLPYDDMPDDFYELSVNEVRKLFTDLSQKREELENTPLQVAAVKNLEESKKVLSQLHDYKKVVLRILFPDRTVLQGTFGPLDTLQTVINFVKDYLQNPSEAFDLYVTPPKQLLKADATLIDSNLVPSALIHFGPHSSDPSSPGISSRQYLKDDIMSKLTSPEAATFSASRTRGIAGNNESSDAKGASSSSDGSTKRTQPFSVPGPSKASNSKVPKWFKPSGK